MGDYRKLEVWQTAHVLAREVYDATAVFPRNELFGLTSQIRRAAVSTAANIAEGCGRNSDPELKRFARIALASANELEYYLLLAAELGILADQKRDHLTLLSQRVRSMLGRLQRALPAAERARRHPIADSG